MSCAQSRELVGDSYCLVNMSCDLSHYVFPALCKESHVVRPWLWPPTSMCVCVCVGACACVYAHTCILVHPHA